MASNFTLADSLIAPQTYVQLLHILFPLYHNRGTFVVGDTTVDILCPGLHLLLVSVPRVIMTPQLATPSPAIILQQGHPAAAGGRCILSHYLATPGC